MHRCVCQSTDWNWIGIWHSQFVAQINFHIRWTPFDGDSNRFARCSRNVPCLRLNYNYSFYQHFLTAVNFHSYIHMYEYKHISLFSHFECPLNLLYKLEWIWREGRICKGYNRGLGESDGWESVECAFCFSFALSMHTEKVTEELTVWLLSKLTFYIFFC